MSKCSKCGFDREVYGKDLTLLIKGQEALHTQLEQTQKMLADRIMDYTTAQGRLEVAVRALEFYANKKDNWFSGGMEGDGNSYSGEHGDKAQEALIQITERSSDES